MLIMILIIKAVLNVTLLKQIVSLERQMDRHGGKELVDNPILQQRGYVHEDLKWRYATPHHKLEYAAHK